MLWQHYGQVGELWENYSQVGVLWQHYSQVGVLWENYSQVGVLWEYYGQVGVLLEHYSHVGVLWERYSQMDVLWKNYSRAWCLKSTGYTAPSCVSTTKMDAQLPLGPITTRLFCCRVQEWGVSGGGGDAAVVCRGPDSERGGT